MQVMDIVNRALFKSGAVPSFNPDEVPEDMQQHAADVLRNEIISDLNCDRTLDITEIVKPFKPEFGIVDLTTPPLDYPFQIYGPTKEPYGWFMSDWVEVVHNNYTFTHLWDWLKERGLVTFADGDYMTITPTTEWDTDQFGKYRNIAIWTSDFHLIEVKINPDDGNFFQMYSTSTESRDDFKKRITNHQYTVPFAPMRVTEVYKASSGEELKYVHAGEFVSAEFRYAMYVYMTEDLMGTLRIRFHPNFGDEPVLLVLPVPITVRNTFEEPEIYQGEIIAPNKFRSFLIYQLAYCMAVDYGISTDQKMLTQSAKSYMGLVRNLNKQEHPQDIERKIFNYLQRGRTWRGNGYTGGIYGR